MEVQTVSSTGIRLPILWDLEQKPGKNVAICRQPTVYYGQQGKCQQRRSAKGREWLLELRIKSFIFWEPIRTVIFRELNETVINWESKRRVILESPDEPSVGDLGTDAAETSPTRGTESRPSYGIPNDLAHANDCWRHYDRRWVNDRVKYEKWGQARVVNGL
jgi:hypothetical protein